MTRPFVQNRYEVLTWDVDKEKFTPQKGVRRGPYTLWRLKQALRKLREIGYGCEYSSRSGRGGNSDSSVLVSRIGPATSEPKPEPTLFTLTPARRGGE